MERLQASSKRVTLDLSLHIEFAAAHEEMALGIGADKTAFVVEKLGAADWTKLPPVFLFLFICLGRIGSIHDFSPRNDGENYSALARNLRALSPRTFRSWPRPLLSTVVPSARSCATMKKRFLSMMFSCKRINLG
jgi:hypothetical protein